MTRFNANSQTFIIRFWSEPREHDDEEAELRGVIEHVSSGKRHYFMRLEEIPGFIAPYVQDLGVEPKRLRTITYLWRQIWLILIGLFKR